MNFYRVILLVAMSLCLVAVMMNFIPVESDQQNKKAHQNIQCAPCHQLVATTKAAGIPATGMDYICRDCHQSLSKTNTVFHKNSSKLCSDCHVFHDTKIIQAGDKSFKFDFGNVNLEFQCRTCHANTFTKDKISEGHRQAIEIYHKDYQYLQALTPSQSCMVCHSKQTSIKLALPPDIKIPLMDQHSSHPTGMVVTPGRGNRTNRIRLEIDKSVILFNNRIECQTCHIFGSANKFLLENEENPYQMCKKCHEHNG